MADEKTGRDPSWGNDRVSDVADWGDREVKHKLFKDMTPEELAKVEELAKKVPVIDPEDY